MSLQRLKLCQNTEYVCEKLSAHDSTSIKVATSLGCGGLVHNADPLTITKNICFIRKRIWDKILKLKVRIHINSIGKNKEWLRMKQVLVSLIWVGL